MNKAMSNVIDFKTRLHIKLIRDAVANFANCPAIQDTILAMKLAQLVEEMDINSRE